MTEDDSSQAKTTEDDSTDLTFQIESRLMSHGVYVTQLDEYGEGESKKYHLIYESVAADSGVIPHREIGRVINVFRDLHADEWEGADIEGTVLSLEGKELGSWYVEATWIEELHSGDLSEVAFSERVIETVQPAR